jgi:hypothetical protein
MFKRTDDLHAKNGKDETVKLTTILFDLDGTLLPMDNEAFTKGYFKLLAAKLAPHGYEPKQLVDAIWAGTATAPCGCLISFI